MIGIYFSGTGNSKYALEVFIREYDNNSVLFSIEDKRIIEHINSHDKIVFSYPVQYSAVPKILSDFIHNNSSVWQGKRVFIIATMAQYALFDLSEFLKLPKVNHTKQDEDIMIDILNCVYELKPDNKVGALQKLISSKKIFKTNKNEIRVIMDILGICGILETAEHRCYAESIYNCIDRNPPELTNDYAYPVNWWRAKDGINTDRMEKVFGPYLEAFLNKE